MRPKWRIKSSFCTLPIFFCLSFYKIPNNRVKWHIHIGSVPRTSWLVESIMDTRFDSNQTNKRNKKKSTKTKQNLCLSFVNKIVKHNVGAVGWNWLWNRIETVVSGNVLSSCRKINQNWISFLYFSHKYGKRCIRQYLYATNK